MLVMVLEIWKVRKAPCTNVPFFPNIFMYSRMSCMSSECERVNLLLCYGLLTPLKSQNTAYRWPGEQNGDCRFKEVTWL